MQKAVIIIPTYNEAKTIEKTLTSIWDVISNHDEEKLKNWDISILIVDDTSPDGTYRIIEELQKKHLDLHLLINKEKSGLGGAYLKGMAKAFGELQADVVFEFDADLSHDPKKLPIFLAKIDAGYDMVLGSRYIPGGSIPQDWGLHRKFLSVFGNIVIMLVLGNFSVRDWTGGYRAITKKVYEHVKTKLDSHRFAGYTFQIGFLYNTVKNNFKIVEVPFHFKDREAGESKIGSEYIKNTLLYIFKVRMQEIVNSRIFKFLVVGTIGAFSQLIMANILPNFIKFNTFPLKILPDFLSIEFAVMTNFILSNLWTFSDRRLNPSQYVTKFFTFNLASGGSILIQTIVISLGIALIGLKNLFILPIIGFVINSRTIFHMTGIIIGMSWNFFAYNKIIWKAKK